MKVNKTHIISLLFTIVSLGFFSSCDDEDRTYQGPIFYEFSPSEAGQSASGSNNLIEKTVSEVGDTQFCIQMIKKNNETTRIKFRIAKELYFVDSASRYVVTKPTSGQYSTVPTTAQLGTDYEVIANKGVEFDPQTGIGFVSIVANELFAYVTLKIKNIDGTMLYIALEDTNNAKANIPTSLLAVSIVEE